MPSCAEHSCLLTSRTSNVLPTVDSIKNYQSQIVVLDTSQRVAISLPFLLLKFYTSAFIILCTPFYLQIYLCLCLTILQPKFSSTIHVYKECS